MIRRRPRTRLAGHRGLQAVQRAAGSAQGDRAQNHTRSTPGADAEGRSARLPNAKAGILGLFLPRVSV